ncbi:MAG: hypothetical protein OSA89_16730 [Mariniblastus sp.]|nr:hypothetical protein [Mariniblastus sp.]
MNSKINLFVSVIAFVTLAFPSPEFATELNSQKPVRVFIFAGQSNMVGSDSKVSDIGRFPPFASLELPQEDIKFSYSIGRENKFKSDGWVALSPVNNVVGPELSFARRVTANSDGPIAIIKCAAGGTHLGGDWNPDNPSGFEMYPLALDLIRKSLAELDRQNIEYQLEGFMWHQGENDMFNEQYMANYGDNLENFIKKWRTDLDAPELKFFIGELCTKTIWGMDLRPRMYAISVGQKSVTDKVHHTAYVPTSHVGVEIGGGVGLHYHYGTLGQLEHGVNYADAYLRSIGVTPAQRSQLSSLPFANKSTIKLFVLAGHRNMEGERAFTQNLTANPQQKELLEDQKQIPFRYQLGGGYLASNHWEALGPTGYYETFGPELSFGATLKKTEGNIAIAKFTHSGSQIVDWTPEGSEAKSRNLYPQFIEFIKDSISDLESKGHPVELQGIFYHVGENDMSFGPFRKQSPTWIQSFIKQSRIDLDRPTLNWFVSQQPPTNHEQVNAIDVTSELARLSAEDPHWFHIRAFELPKQEKQLVLDESGVIELGKLLAEEYQSTKD